MQAYTTIPTKVKPWPPGTIGAVIVALSTPLVAAAGHGSAPGRREPDSYEPRPLSILPARWNG